MQVGTSKKPAQPIGTHPIQAQPIRAVSRVSPEAAGSRMVRSAILASPTSGRRAGVGQMRGTGAWATVVHGCAGAAAIRLSVSVCVACGTDFDYLTIQGMGRSPMELFRIKVLK